MGKFEECSNLKFTWFLKRTDLMPGTKTILDILMQKMKPCYLGTDCIKCIFFVNEKRKYLQRLQRHNGHFCSFVTLASVRIFGAKEWTHFFSAERGIEWVTLDKIPYMSSKWNTWRCSRHCENTKGVLVKIICVWWTYVSKRGLRVEMQASAACRRKFCDFYLWYFQAHGWISNLLVL